MNHRLPNRGEMQRAFLSGDVTYDGIFVTAVRTTGIFCKPSCPARKPKPENVEFFDTPRAALLAGYRPCKRCRPLSACGALPDWMNPLMEVSESAGPRLRDPDLRQRGLDPARVRRGFLKHFGMTFHAYQRIRRLATAIPALQQGESVMTVGLRQGFSSESGFRDAFEKAFGATPGNGREVNIVFAQRLTTPLGVMVATASDDGVCLLDFGDRPALATELASIKRRREAAIVPGIHPHLTALSQELDAYFAGRMREFTVPIDTGGTPFQRLVWRRLAQIPYGETMSYDALARDIGRPGAQRAVGRANGANALGILIPCHRVVRHDGTLGGYGGGLWRKKWLLNHERQRRITKDGDSDRAAIDAENQLAYSKST